MNYFVGVVIIFGEKYVPRDELKLAGTRVTSHACACAKICVLRAELRERNRERGRDRHTHTHTNA